MPHDTDLLGYPRKYRSIFQIDLLPVMDIYLPSAAWAQYFTALLIAFKAQGCLAFFAVKFHRFTLILLAEDRNWDIVYMEHERSFLSFLSGQLK